MVALKPIERGWGLVTPSPSNTTTVLGPRNILRGFADIKFIELPVTLYRNNMANITFQYAFKLFGLCYIILSKTF